MPRSTRTTVGPSMTRAYGGSRPPPRRDPVIRSGARRRDHADVEGHRTLPAVTSSPRPAAGARPFLRAGGDGTGARAHRRCSLERPRGNTAMSIARDTASPTATVQQGAGDGEGPLAGVRVLDLGTVYAAPITAMLLGDYGADVLKIEHPRGDPARTHGPSKDGHGLWWKVIARNKRTATLVLSRPEGQEILGQLVADADVVIENFRPGVMEKWRLGPDRLLE